jgi:hypothetical protein
VSRAVVSLDVLCVVCHVLPCFWIYFFVIGHVFSYLWNYCLKCVACYRISGRIVCRVSSAIVCLELLFEVCHVLSCLCKYCLKCVTCCRVSGNIFFNVSRAVVSLKVFFEACHILSCL